MYFFTLHALENSGLFSQGFLPALISSLLIGALYPLTQIYQHEEDLKDQVVTISYLLGKRGSFVFSMFLFLLATGLMYIYCQKKLGLPNFYYFLAFLLPVVLFFLYWMRVAWKDNSRADFRHSMIMNMISTLCTTSYFLFLNFHRS